MEWVCETEFLCELSPREHGATLNIQPRAAIPSLYTELLHAYTSLRSIPAHMRPPAAALEVFYSYARARSPIFELFGYRFYLVKFYGYTY